MLAYQHAIFTCKKQENEEEGCTSFKTKGLNIDEKLISLPLTYRARDAARKVKYLCTRTDDDIQGVESGSSILIIMNKSLSEFTPYMYGVGSSFMFSYYRVLPEPYSQRTWGVSSHRFCVKRNSEERMAG